MFLESLRLYNFRNLHNQTVQPGPGTNLIIGQNGQGKTNFLEAVYFLSQARSFRTADLRELIAWQQEGASVFGKVRTGKMDLGGAAYELGLAVQAGGKEAFLNGEKLQLFNDFIGKLVTVTFVPGDLSIVKGSPQFRRKFFDRHLADYRPAAINHFFTYQKALRHKGKLLKDGSPTAAELDPWDQILAETAAKIETARLEFVSRINERAAALLAALAPQDGTLELKLESELIKAGQVMTAEQCLACYQKNREREIFQRTCLTGPQRDDVLITLNRQDCRSFASQGQARSVTLVLKLAVIEILESENDEPPVVLLDDVESELDKTRSHALLEMVLKHGRQVFITGTKPLSEADTALSKCTVFSVENGVIKLV